jgi:serine/threonine protein kinase
MTPERWSRVAEIYDSALEQAPAARAGFLATACGEDVDLRREVESLLAQEQRPVVVDRPLGDAAASVLGRPSQLTAGSTIGAHRVVGLLGEGGMGQVYRAHDTKLQRDVALKILPDAFVHDTDRVARFTREAQVLASLNHPNIGAIYGLEDSGEVHALVLELVEGPTLAERIARGPLPLDEALPIARQIAEALEAAHEHGIVHRDLKPANIKVRDDGTVKVLDFGLAKLTTGDARSGAARDLTHSPTLLSPAVTTAGVILGTAAYMSPEQAKGRPADKRSDVWAFGCVLYEMLTGKRAFEGEDVSETLAAVLRAEPDWSLLERREAGYLREAIQGCLNKDPRKRIPHIAAVRFLVDREPPKPVAVERAGGRAPWLMAAAAMTALIGGTAAIWVTWPASPPSPQVWRFELPLAEPLNRLPMARRWCT